MTQLYEINVKLSDNQKKNLSNAYHKKGNSCFETNKGCFGW